jgi:peptidoglycan hydrolase-like protein with peptidoglycan-binding domain
MKKNPKVIAGIIGIVVLLAGCVVLATYMIPTIGEVRREMSLTPTPLPPVPDTVRSQGAAEMVTPEPALHNGSQGEKVWQLQERLKELGYYTGEVDGQFGPGTKEAVIAFQKKNGLDADGLAGEETQKVLYSENAVPNS